MDNFDQCLTLWYVTLYLNDVSQFSSIFITTTLDAILIDIFVLHNEKQNQYFHFQKKNLSGICVIFLSWSVQYNEHIGNLLAVFLNAYWNETQNTDASDIERNAWHSCDISPLILSVPQFDIRICFEGRQNHAPLCARTHRKDSCVHAQPACCKRHFRALVHTAVRQGVNTHKNSLFCFCVSSPSLSMLSCSRVLFQHMPNV